MTYIVVCNTHVSLQNRQTCMLNCLGDEVMLIVNECMASGI